MVRSLIAAVLGVALSLVLVSCSGPQGQQQEKQWLMYKASGARLDLDIRVANLRKSVPYTLCLNGKDGRPGNEQLKSFDVLPEKKEGYYDFQTVDTDPEGTLTCKTTVDDLPPGTYEVTFLIKDNEQDCKAVLIRDKWRFHIEGSGPAGSPTIEFTSVPVAGGGGDSRGDIAGRVVGASNPNEYKIVLYACTDRWYVQPLVDSPFTPIGTDGKWKNWTHLGMIYGALLVRPSYPPKPQVDALPVVGDDVIAVVEAPASQ